MLSDTLIPLKKDWDLQPHLGQEQGYHVVRKKQESQLVDFFARRKEGSLLISGKRGVGKSSIIFAAIEKAKKQLSDNQELIPVLIIAPSFELSDESDKLTSDNFQKFKKLVLQTIIRRLYSPTSKKISDNKLKDAIKLLYTKAVAKEVKQEITNTDSNQNINTKETTSEFQISNNRLGIILGGIISGIVLSSIPITGFDVPKNLIAVLLASIPSLAILYKLKKTKTTTEIQSSVALDYYLHDYSISNLQSDLEELLQELSTKNKKLIFIIDELDKINPDNVINVFKSLKTTITNGNAIFVFVTDDQLYQMIEKSGKDRTPEYTLFTHKIFLERSLFKEMELFIDNIILESSGLELEDNKKYHNFKNYACFISQTDFFNLGRVLRDHITDHDSKGNPVLNIELTDNQIVLSRIQKAMGQIYERYEYTKPSDWLKNDQLLEKLYWFLNELNNLQPSEQFEFHPEDTNGSLMFPPDNKPTTVGDDVMISTIKDLTDHLVRLNYLTQPSPNVYTVLGTIDDVPTNPVDVISQGEKEFIQNCNEFRDTLIDLINIVQGEDNTKFETEDFIGKRKAIFAFVKELGIDLDPYLSILTIYDQLNKDFPELHRREKLEQHSKQIIQAKSVLLNNAHLVISKTTTHSLTKITYSTFPNMQQLDAQLGFAIPQQFFAVNTPNSLLDFQVLGKNTKLLIIQNLPDNIKPIFEQSDVKGIGIILVNVNESTDKTTISSKNVFDFCDKAEIKPNRFSVTHKLPILNFELSEINETKELVKSIIAWGTSGISKNTPKTKPTTIKLKQEGGQDGAGQIQQVLQSSVDLYTYSDNNVYFQLKTSEKQCSDIRFHIILDEIEIGITDWLGYPNREEELPLETEIISIENIKQGDHKLTFQPEGRDGGCNKGFIPQWEIILDLYK